MKVRFSIRYKILSVVTILLVAAISFYLLLAMQIFKQDKTELVFDLNRGFVSTLGAEIETSFRGVADKLKLFALLSAGNQQAKVFEQVLQNDPLLVQIELFERGFDGKLRLLSKISDRQFLSLYNLDEKFFRETLPGQKPIPFNEIQSASRVVWNAALKNQPPLVGIGIAVMQEGVHQKPERMLAVVGYIKTDTFLKNLRSSSLTQAFVVDKGGRILLHANQELMVDSLDMSTSPLVAELSKNKISSGVLEYKHEDKTYLGAYTKTGFSGVSVVSQVGSEKAFIAVNHLVRRSFIFALIVSTVTFIATVFFSRTLTQPLQNLLGAMQKVSEGKLDTELRVNSLDEISVLSNSFNQMTSDLKSSREQLEEINRELENKVVDRTKKLEEQNRAVKEAQEALLRTTRLASVGEIAGRTAHEVLNPLTSIMNRIQKVQKRLTEEIMSDKNLLGEIVKAWKSDLDEKGYEGFLKTLNEPSQINPKMTLLQEDLSNISQIFSRWDEGIGTMDTDTKFLLTQAARIEKILGSMRSLSHIKGERSNYGAHQVLMDAANIVGDLFSKNKVKLQTEFLAGTDMVLVDRDEMIQVLTNMLKNSLQAVIENGKSNGVVIMRTRVSGEKLIIDVVDNGVGIPPENQKRLFESNFSTKGPDIGTGLGLSISRRFIRAFNGDLFFVSSKPGQETCFRIELPLQGVEKEEAAA